MCIEDLSQKRPSIVLNIEGGGCMCVSECVCERMVRTREQENKNDNTHTYTHPRRG